MEREATRGGRPTPLRRADSFLGIHFDFHADEMSTCVGERTTPEMIEHILRSVRPDYVQCDCKGHPGLSSYPTRVGHRAPGIVGDPLKVWREVTAEHGVALYLHYSGVWDREAVRRRPEWARLDENGEPDGNITSTFGPYVDELLIPQIEELWREYHIDGVWIDGDCWAALPDYNTAVVRGFQAAHGGASIPYTPEDPYYDQFLEYCREGFRTYLRHYVDTLKRRCPGIQIASNWAFSSHMPEPVSADVDFLSGDYSWKESVNSARLEGRFLAGQGMPWDLMAWSFAFDSLSTPTFSTKTAIQLKQETAVVLALGGGVSVYFRQNRTDGAIYSWQMDIMAEVAGFCRERQPWCHGARSVAQIGLVCSPKAYYSGGRRLFGRSDALKPLRGILYALLDAQHAVDVVMPHQSPEMRYDLLVVPEWAHLEDSWVEQLGSYVRSGGRLLLIGSKTADLASQLLGISSQGMEGPGALKPRDDEEQPRVHWLEYGHVLAGLFTRYRKAPWPSEARGLGTICATDDTTEPLGRAAHIIPHGSGSIAVAPIDCGSSYIRNPTTVVRDFIDRMVRELLPDPLVSVKGSRYVDVTVNLVGDAIAIHLVNTAGPHDHHGGRVFDEIPRVGPMDIEVNLRRAKQWLHRQPYGADIEPSGDKPELRIIGEVMHIHVPSLEIHKVVVLR